MFFGLEAITSSTIVQIGAILLPIAVKIITKSHAHLQPARKFPALIYGSTLPDRLAGTR